MISHSKDWPWDSCAPGVDVAAAIATTVASDGQGNSAAALTAARAEMGSAVNRMLAGHASVPAGMGKRASTKLADVNGLMERQLV